MLHQVQTDRTPSDFRPMPTVGAGVYELRASDSDGIARLMYIAKFAEAVLTCCVFQKKTQKTPQKDIDKAAKRLRDLMRERNKWCGTTCTRMIRATRVAQMETRANLMMAIGDHPRTGMERPRNRPAARDHRPQYRT